MWLWINVKTVLFWTKFSDKTYIYKQLSHFKFSYNINRKLKSDDLGTLTQGKIYSKCSTYVVFKHFTVQHHLNRHPIIHHRTWIQRHIIITTHRRIGTVTVRGNKVITRASQRQMLTIAMCRIKNLRKTNWNWLVLSPFLSSLQYIAFSLKKLIQFIFFFFLCCRTFSSYWYW